MARKPSERQKRAFKEMVENGSITQKDALIKAGYSSNTAIAPTKVTESDGWKQLLEEYMPDEDLAKRHKELLWKNDKYGPETNAVRSALDMAYKMKRRYAEEGQQGNINIILVDYRGNGRSASDGNI